MATTRTHGRPAQAGFSLLETIAAILLLAVAFGAVMHVAGAATQVTTHARELSRVAMWADATLDAAGRGAALGVGNQEGWYDKRHRWRLTVTPQPLATGQGGDLHLYRLDLDISWRDGARERHEHFSTLRLQDEVTPPPATSVAGPPPMDDA
jgi:general secretion pathway protein I